LNCLGRRGPFAISDISAYGIDEVLELDLDPNLRHYAGAFEAPEALDLSGPLSRMGFQDPVYVIQAKTLALII